MATIHKPITGKHHSRWINRDTSKLLSSIGRYTRFVAFSKIGLGAVSLILMLTIIVIPALEADNAGLRIAFTTLGDRSDALPVMTNPRFQGVDDNNQPYTVTADSAMQEDEKTIVLANVQADIFTHEGTWLSMTSKQGKLETEKKFMALSGNVTLFHDQGYEFVTESIDIDMSRQVASGSQPIDGQGPMGQIHAQAFDWQNNQKVLRFTGGVKLTVNVGG